MKSLGMSTHIFPACFIFPACLPASGPNPQKKSARTLPLIALPASWATMRRCNGLFELGQVVARKTGDPWGMARGSIARLLPAVSGTPSAPIGPERSSGSSRKNMKREFCCSNLCSFSGFCWPHCLIPCIEAFSNGSSPFCTNSFPIER